MVMPGVPELLIISGVIVLLFGAKKLPKLAGAVGESIKNFRTGVKEADEAHVPLMEKLEGKDKTEKTKEGKVVENA